MKKVFSPRNVKFQNRLLAAGSSLVIAAILLLIFANGQWNEAFYSFFVQPLATVSGWRRILGAATVNILVALGVCIMYHCRQYSLISEGAFLAGACTATGLLLSSGDRPVGFSLALALVVGTLVGALVALPSAVLVNRRNVNVTLSSVIVDFVVLELASYILERFLSDPTLTTGSFAIPVELRLPYLYQPLGIRVGTLMALLFAFGVFMVLYRTRTGYTLRMVGASQKAAAHLGLSAGSVILFSHLAGGALAGLGGAVQMMGISSRYSWAGEFSNIGFFAILVALLADCNPAWVPVTALLFGYLSTGGTFLQTATGLPSQLAGICQACSLLVLLAISYCRRTRKRTAAVDLPAENVKKEGDGNGTV